VFATVAAGRDSAEPTDPPQVPAAKTSTKMGAASSTLASVALDVYLCHECDHSFHSAPLPPAARENCPVECPLCGGDFLEQIQAANATNLDDAPAYHGVSPAVSEAATPLDPATTPSRERGEALAPDSPLAMLSPQHASPSHRQLVAAMAMRNGGMSPQELMFNLAAFEEPETARAMHNLVRPLGPPCLHPAEPPPMFPPFSPRHPDEKGIADPRPSLDPNPTHVGALPLVGMCPRAPPR